jgi:hypothetical protein
VCILLCRHPTFSKNLRDFSEVFLFFVQKVLDNPLTMVYKGYVGWLWRHVMSREYYEEMFLENKFFEYKADFAAKGCTEEEAEIAAAESLDKLMEMYG